MSLLFPSLVGQGWSVHKKPKFDTRVAAHATGREARVNKYLTPMWEFELTFDALDMTATGDYGALGAQSMQTLAGFFLQCQGKANPFVYVDPTDNTVTGAAVGTGDGVTTTFVLTHPIGSYLEPVGALINVSAVYLNGAQAFGWAVQQPNLLEFGSAPASGVAITADFKFGYACRFSEDVEDFEEFMSMLSGVKTLAFQSVRDVVPLEIAGLRTLVLLGDGSGGGNGGGAGEFCAPSDWNNSYNKIEAIGGGAGGGFGYGAGGGGGAYTFRDNVVLATGQCVPFIVGSGGPAGVSGGRNGLAGWPTTFGEPGDPHYIYADYAGSIYESGGGGVGGSTPGFAGSCTPGINLSGPGALNGGVGGGWTLTRSGGGGGAAGPNGVGAGSSNVAFGSNAGSGGGGANGGGTGNPIITGGTARDGTPGGGAGQDGQNGSGGGGGAAGDNPGGNGSADRLWFVDGVWYGPSSGGGGGGGVEPYFGPPANIPGLTGAGGQGGGFSADRTSYGLGGGGGAGGCEQDGTTSGAGWHGAVIVTYLAVESS